MVEMYFRNYDQTRVFFRLGNIPVGYAVAMALFLAFSMLICTAVGTFRYAQWMQFSTTAPISESWWRMVVHPMFIVPHVKSIISLVFIGYFGHQLENAMRQRDFVLLLLFLWLAPPFIALALVPLNHSVWAGSGVISFGLFFALVCHQPNLPSFFGIPLKWFGLLFLTAFILEQVSVRMWVPLLVQGLMVFAVWRWMKYQGYALPWGVADDIGFEIPRRKFSFRQKSPRNVSPKIKPQTRIDINATSAIDRILDKVSRDGIHTLTEKERRILKNASDELQK